MKKTWIIIAIIVVVVLAIVLTLTQTREEPKEIKIGVILPLTGGAAKYGEAVKKGVDLAVQQINSQGGVEGKKIRLLYEDDQGDPKAAVAALQKLFATHKIPACIGPLWSSPVLAVAPIANRKKIIVLSPGATSPTISDAGDFIFRNVASDAYEAATIARFTYEELGINAVSVLYINNDFGLGELSSFRKRFEELGGEIIGSETFDQDSVDFRTQLTKLKATEARAIYLVGYKEMGPILKQSRELGLDKQIISFSMFEDPEILEVAGEGAEGVYYSFQSYDPTRPDSLIKDFVTAYHQKYKSEPDIFAALGFDAARILAEAIKAGGTKAENIKRALYAIQNFNGVTGKTSFDDKGDVTKTMSIKKVEDGKFVWVRRVYQPYE